MGWLDIGAGAAGAVVGQGMGMLFGRANDERQLRQQAKLNKQAIESNKEMADHNQQLQFDMWNKTNYGAQKKHMEEAGLNPALMYGMGGGGGVTAGAASGSGVSGGKAADSSQTQGTNGAMGMQMAQLALLDAQKKNIDADTKNKEAGAVDATAGAVKKGAETENVQADTKLTGFKTKIAEIEASVAGKTQGDAIRTIVAGADKLMADAQLSDNNKTISDQTMIEQKRIIQEGAIGAILRNAATKTGIALDQAKIQEIATTLTQKWEGLKLGKEGLQVARDNMEQLTEAMLWGAGIQAGGQVVRGVMDIATKGGAGTVTQTMRDNFDGTGHTTTTRTTPIR